MYSFWLFLLIVLSVNIVIVTNLRCNEDSNGSLQLIENCRACVVFIDARTPPPISITVSPRKNHPSIEDLFLYDEEKYRRRRQHRNSDAIIRQKCARASEGPLYGYNQTHCYCNSNQCNSNIQQCIYEVTSKRHFSCYHGSNSNSYPLEIRKKCRSCRILAEVNLTYYYECLTFGEQEQKNQTYCTCQYPMCNQDLTTCQRFQQIPSQPRTHLVREISFNSTNNTSTSTTNTTTVPISTTVTTITTSSMIISIKMLSTLSILNETENSTSFNETKHVETVLIEIKNHANHFSWNFSFLSILFFIYHM